MTEKYNIVGIGGLSRSGKDTLAHMLIEDGFFGVSVGDITREFSQKRHSDDPHPISRINLTETANWLRESRGPDVLMQIALERFEEAKAKGKTYKGLVCWSIRAPVEVDIILNHGGELIWIDVSDHLRYERAMNDLREGEPHLSFEDYLAQENTQFKPLAGIPENIQMNLPYVKSKATKILVNETNDISEFKRNARTLLQEIKF